MASTKLNKNCKILNKGLENKLDTSKFKTSRQKSSKASMLGIGSNHQIMYICMHVQGWNPIMIWIFDYFHFESQ